MMDSTNGTLEGSFRRGRIEHWFHALRMDCEVFYLGYLSLRLGLQSQPRSKPHISSQNLISPKSSYPIQFESQRVWGCC